MNTLIKTLKLYDQKRLQVCTFAILKFGTKMIEDKNPQRTSISQLGEFGLINHLTKNFEITQPSTIKGIGDDAAVLDFKDKKVVVSTDLLIEGVHFDLAYMPLKHLGYKAVVVNVSDICAMNAKPTQITVSVAVSNRFPLEALEELFEVWTARQVGFHDKPIILANWNGYYDKLLQFIHESHRDGFLTQSHLKKILIVNTLDEIFEALES